MEKKNKDLEKGEYDDILAKKWEGTSLADGIEFF